MRTRCIRVETFDLLSHLTVYLINSLIFFLIFKLCDSFQAFFFGFRYNSLAKSRIWHPFRSFCLLSCVDSNLGILFPLILSAIISICVSVLLASLTMLTAAVFCLSYLLTGRFYSPKLNVCILDFCARNLFAPHI